MMMQNLIYVFADQWRAHAIGAALEDRVCTPHMDAFAAESLSFTNALSTYPLCSPHRASMLTGKYPYSCGVWTNCKIGLSETVMLKPQEQTIGDVLKKEGWQTAYIGKWHLDASELNFTSHPESGAVDWDAYTPPGERRHGFDFWYSYGAMDRHLDPHYWQDTIEPERPGKWSPEHETDIAVRYLQNRNKEQPFCMFLSWNPPHPPYDLLPGRIRQQWEDRELKFRPNVPLELQSDPAFQKSFREYYAAIEGLDEQFGRLIGYLKTAGLYDETVIVLSADHGDCMGAHGLMGKNVWYEESIRIPFYIRSPQVRPGTSKALFASQDHMPTLLELLGCPVPESVQGKSFAGIIRGEEMEDEPEHAFLCMIPGMPEMVAGYEARGLNQKCFGWRGIRTGDALFVADHGTVPDAPVRWLLYDLVKDPYQLSPRLLTAADREAEPWLRILRGYLQQLHDPFLISGNRGNDREANREGSL